MSGRSAFTGVAEHSAPFCRNTVAHLSPQSTAPSQLLWRNNSRLLRCQTQLRLYASTSSDSSTAASAQEDGVQMQLAASPLIIQQVESKRETSSNGTSTNMSSPPQADNADVESHLATLVRPASHTAASVPSALQNLKKT